MSRFSAVRCLLLAGALVRFSAALGQDAPAPAQDANCPPAPPLPEAPAPVVTASPCITLDASRSVDSLAGLLTFRWQMGDGQVRRGVKFDYCYAALGRYVIELDVLDSLSGEVRQHELERVVDFQAPAVAAFHREPSLRFDAPDRAKAGQPVTFAVTTSELPPCLPSTIRFDWNFRDGLLAQGKSVTHTFRRPGTFVVRLAIDGSGLDDCLARACVTRTIVIEE